MHETFHLVPAETWAAADPRKPYAAESLASEGFIHCTDGVEALGHTFDRHFGTDPRPFLAVALDLDALGAPWRYDVVDSPYPHIYGAIERGAMLGVNRVVRAADGRFSGLSPL